MKCKQCGANALFQEDFIVCENCGSRYQIESTYKNTEVFLCYVENDINGRRTKDSIIAQDIYNRLENAKINVFYERISAGNLLEDDLEKACYSAIYHAKTILIIGTEKRNFENLLQKYYDIIRDKKIIPVCSDMNMYTLPEKIKKLQALNYDAVGASSDLIKNVLIILGRETEIVNKSASKKKRILIVVTCCIIAICLSIGALWLYHVEQSKKQDKAEEITDVKLVDYKLAQEFIEQGKYAEAIKLLYTLGDYENSKNMLALVYEKFEGYYWDESSGISLHLNVSENRKATVEVSGSIHDVVVRITETGEIEVDTINFEYIDSENNSGTITLLLKNEMINLQIKPNEVTELSIGERKIKFLIAEKSDKPRAKSVSAETLLGWLDNRTTIAEILRKGFELEEQGEMFSESRGAEEAYSYKIKDTNIELAIARVAFTQDYTGVEDRSQDKILFGIIAPASIILPDKIGKKSPPFTVRGYLYAPHGTFLSCLGDRLVLGDWAQDKSYKVIEPDTPVAFVSQKTFSKNVWNEIVTKTMENYLYLSENAGKQGQILPFSSERLITQDDISQLSPEQLKLARNEIYARRGRIFKDQNIQSYFESQSWYHGQIDSSDFSEDMLSQIERENVKFIMSYEK